MALEQGAQKRQPMSRVRKLQKCTKKGGKELCGGNEWLVMRTLCGKVNIRTTQIHMQAHAQPSEVRGMSKGQCYWHLACLFGLGLITTSGNTQKRACRLHKAKKTRKRESIST